MVFGSVCLLTELCQFDSPYMSLHVVNHHTLPCWYCIIDAKIVLDSTQGYQSAYGRLVVHCHSLSSRFVCCAAGAKNVLTFTLRSPANWQPSTLSMPSRHSAQHPSYSAGTPSKPAAMVVVDSHPNTSSCCTKDTCHCDRVVPTVTGARLDSSGTEHVDHDVTAQGTAGSESAAGSAISNSNLDDALHDAQQLIRAAERIVKESCGEGWLLQPFIPDMERNEYRSAIIIMLLVTAVITSI